MDRIEPVVSGLPYRIASVNGVPPAGLDDFVATVPVALAVTSAHGGLSVSGIGHADGQSVVLTEKGEDGIGKDIRTWQIVRVDHHFEATPLSSF